MKVESAPEAPDGEPWAPLVDLSRVPLDRAVGEDNEIIERALGRVLRSLHDRDGVISSFGSFVSDS
ncbi:hypothetical protein JIG36_20265 [Actinoplanes sp. LDG1-06]|uniref:FXSXX-COOH protein n=1 Tax=Paractinoplanes ovalisporus TaxID=2810368 RepID=A0ABS2ADJ5_9ACTN|nr:hypothetical protein [Actinoplanes ovalisporus]MBM2617895.1 hypothetical protein [Actinoplanes ovalisporus]